MSPVALTVEQVAALKVKCHLMFGIVALAVDQIIRIVDYRAAPA